MDFRQMMIAMVGGLRHGRQISVNEQRTHYRQDRKGGLEGQGTTLPDHAEKEVRKLLEHKVSLSAIARVLGISRGRLYRWVRDHV